MKEKILVVWEVAKLVGFIYACWDIGMRLLDAYIMKKFREMGKDSPEFQPLGSFEDYRGEAQYPSGAIHYERADSEEEHMLHEVVVIEEIARARIWWDERTDSERESIVEIWGNKEASIKETIRHAGSCDVCMLELVQKARQSKWEKPE